MIDEEVIVKQFASFCRKILKCEKIDYYRERKYRAERELHLELFEDYEVERLIPRFLYNSPSRCQLYIHVLYIL